MYYIKRNENWVAVDLSAYAAHNGEKKIIPKQTQTQTEIAFNNFLQGFSNYGSFTCKPTKK